MRALLLASLLLAACNRADPPPAAPEQASAEIGTNSYAGAGRDRLCLRQEQDGPAGFVAFAASGDANCSVRGTYDAASKAIVPNGDTACRIPVEVDANGMRLGSVGPACAYYCGPGASFAGKTFSRMDKPAVVTDLGGDPLC